jgi:hypothetical protein
MGDGETGQLGVGCGEVLMLEKGRKQRRESTGLFSSDILGNLNES